MARAIETNPLAHDALLHEMKRMHATAILLAAALGTLSATTGSAFSREAARTLDDLRRIEAKIEALAPKVTPATVALLSERTGSSGSGVIVSEDGLILTAAHVVEGTDQLLVVFPDGKQVQGKVLGANYSKDSAMVRIADAGKWPHVPLGESKSLEAGDWVVALGHSAGFDAARTPPLRFGTVISKGPGYFLTTGCTLIGGDSGGPLFDLEGRLVAIHSSIGKSLQNNNHAGIDGYREDWDRMLAGETWGELSLNPFANPEMPTLGIVMGMVRGMKGLLVESLVPGSPAAAAGVRNGDVILTLDGTALDDGRQLRQILAKRQAGDQVKLGLVRDRKPVEVTVTLKLRQELFDER